MAGVETILFGDHSDAARESEIRKPSSDWSALRHSHVSSIPFHNPRTNFSSPADPRDGQMAVAPFGKDEGPVRPRGRSPRPAPVGFREIHLTTRPLDLPPASRPFSLLFPRLGEINSRCLRVFAAGISPFMDRPPFDRVLLLISAGILRDKWPRRGGKNMNFSSSPLKSSYLIIRMIIVP